MHLFNLFSYTVQPVFNPLPHTANLQQTTLKKSSENIAAKGEIAHHEQFHLLPQRFQKLSAGIASKCICRQERVKNHNWEENNLVFVHRWSIITGLFLHTMSNWVTKSVVLKSGNCYTKVVFSTGLTVQHICRKILLLTSRKK